MENNKKAEIMNGLCCRLNVHRMIEEIEIKEFLQYRLLKTSHLTKSHVHKKKSETEIKLFFSILHSQSFEKDKVHCEHNDKQSSILRNLFLKIPGVQVIFSSLDDMNLYSHSLSIIIHVKLKTLQRILAELEMPYNCNYHELALQLTIVFQSNKSKTIILNIPEL
ncbi:CLUMA_CG011864, isoform A [Clunio marinus]|uniref:CLUMA_CG011864, isoform A n=1 Tax=Clunio marinus TaxID=568069 RepID=A0A1J1IG45_9DIPT|nr:CLUMA_CG011864, isoform A [Clunio marinus]